MKGDSRYSFNGRSSTFRNSIGWLSDWRAMLPSLSILSPFLINRRRVGVAIVELGLFVFEDGLAVDDVLDDAVAVDLDLDRDPLVAVVGLRLRVVAVLGDQLASHHDVRAGRADVRRRSLVLAVATEELDLDRDGEVLVLSHALGRLAVDHRRRCS